MTFTYCPDCGAPLVRRPIGDEGLVPYCLRCQRPHFDNPYTCTITLAVNEYREAALIRQSYVSTDSYVCIAGYLQSGETAEQAAAREVQEELGIRPQSVRYLRSYWFDRRDMLMLGFLARVVKQPFSLSAEVDSARWFPLDQAPVQVRPGSIAQQLILDGTALLASENAEVFQKNFEPDQN